MRLLVLGGTHFLGRHVATAALDRGHEVATFTRGVSGAPPEGARALHGDRDDPAALPAALDGWAPELVVDTSCQTRAAARNAAAVLGDVSRLRVRQQPQRLPRTGRPARSGPRTASRPGPPTTTSTARTRPSPSGRSARPSASGFLTARAGLIVGPHDPIYRLGWWLDRIARGGRVVVPDALDQPIALVDARDLAGWLVEMAEQGRSGGVNATGPAGMTTLGGLLDLCREVTGSDAEWVPVPEEDAARGRRPAVGAPAAVAAARRSPAPAWDVDTTRARELGLPSRPLRESVADTWAWQQAQRAAAAAAGPHRPEPGLPPELEAQLLAAD